MTIEVKKGVSMIGLREPILKALIDIDTIFAAMGLDTIITSTTGDNHSKYSAHWRGDATDLRSRHIIEPDDAYPLAKRIETFIAIQDIIGDQYRVLFENRNQRWTQHYHIEHRPTRWAAT